MRTGWAALPMIGLLAYCAADETSGPRAALAPPFRTSLQAAVVASTKVPSATFSLADFRPLLLRPELSRVAAANEAEAPALAARELEAARVREAPAPSERFRYDFLQARFHERAGEFAPALAAYGRVSAGASALVNYARLGEARALLGLRRAAEVPRALELVPDGEPAATRKWRLLLEAAIERRDLPAAVTLVNRVLEKTSASRERAELEVRLASLSLDAANGENERANWLPSALAWARRAEHESGSSSATLSSARTVEMRALSLLTEAERGRYADQTLDERLETTRALSDARRYVEARKSAEAALAAASLAERDGAAGCELQFLLGKSLVAAREYASAGATFEGLLAHCTDAELRARAEFTAGKAAASDGAPMLAVARFAKLEQEQPQNSLADDARLLGALSYLEAGVEARFTELLRALPDDYPDGDMVVEGSFRLALRRFDKRDYQGAAHVLERVLDNQYSKGARAADFAGRERYFHARALFAMGERERALDEYETVIEEVPLGYYMLCAYNALGVIDEARATAALEKALANAGGAPAGVKSNLEFSGPGFTRALELFGVGELDDGVLELDALGLVDSSRPEILWALSQLYAEAGSVKLSHAAARRALTATPQRWPASTWRAAWQLAFPDPYRATVEREAKRTAQTPALIYAIMREESAFDPDAESPADAYGLMQLIVPTAKMAARPLGLPYDRSALKKPTVNIALGSSVLAKYASAIPENPLLAIAAYNAGPSNAKRWLRERPDTDFDVWVELIPFVETRRYVKRVLASRATYAFLYQTSDFSGFLSLPKKARASAPD